MSENQNKPPVPVPQVTLKIVLEWDPQTGNFAMTTHGGNNIMSFLAMLELAREGVLEKYRKRNQSNLVQAVGPLPTPKM